MSREKIRLRRYMEATLQGALYRSYRGDKEGCFEYLGEVADYVTTEESHLDVEEKTKDSETKTFEKEDYDDDWFVHY